MSTPGTNPPELFKEVFAREFSALVGAGVEKPAAAAQALLAAQRAFQQHQQQEATTQHPPEPLLAAPTGLESDDVQRKGKVAASVSSTLVNKSTARPLAPAIQVPHRFLLLKPPP